MKSLIVLENHFYKDDNGNIWCDRIVDYNYLKRYLDVFEKILVTGRTLEVNKINDNKLLVSGKNVEFIPLPEFKGAKGVLKNFFKLKKIIRETVKNVDCVIYRAPTHISLFTYKEVLKQNNILVLEFMMAADKMFDGKGAVKQILNWLIDKKAKKMCLKATGVSYVTENILQKKYPCKALINPNDTTKFTAKYSSIDLDENMYYRQNWNSSSKPKTFKIVHTGYMDSYRKGQKNLLEIVKKLKEQGYNITLTLIGDGEKRKEFEELAKKLNIDDIVDFKGLIKNKLEILDILRESHLFVFPTQSEGLPRTIIEAMSQSLPCISSPVDGIPELLDDEFLIDYNDINAYSKKIIELINDWDKMIEIGKKNFEKSRKYQKENLEKRRKEFYEKIKKVAINETKEN